MAERGRLSQLDPSDLRSSSVPRRQLFLRAKRRSPMAEATTKEMHNHTTAAETSFSAK
ncbi:hypothetical protein FRACA_3110008 [Frankia canadensis]|uniref:Uncharacterized protein n=1 Tax=Frankia canadensis TaxID=1836972 RepID=A0A2I2KUC7_9ACTN|nr:hypothetical protein FRACA_3110008 [Frankia canadensis]SOU56550.1 hypothetical protein FRACA_3110008 [Frankia canadensis]